MRVYEAIVKALESVGVDAAFGGAGENAAGAMIALKEGQGSFADAVMAALGTRAGCSLTRVVPAP